jgi:5'-deoxynucleotidase YfbR-like HD superfamily hydrolase
VTKFNPQFGVELVQYYKEYEEGNTEAATIAKGLDGLECFFQAVYYEEQSCCGKDLSDIISSARKKITTPILLEWSKILLQYRERLWSEDVEDKDNFSSKEFESSPFPFLKLTANLKAKSPHYWNSRAIEAPESVASHMYHMAIMGMLMPDVSIQSCSRIG